MGGRVLGVPRDIPGWFRYFLFEWSPPMEKRKRSLVTKPRLENTWFSTEIFFALKIQSAIFQSPKLRRYLDPTNWLSIAFCETIQSQADILSTGYMICAYMRLTIRSNSNSWLFTIYVSHSRDRFVVVVVVHPCLLGRIMKHMLRLSNSSTVIKVQHTAVSNACGPEGAALERDWNKNEICWIEKYNSCSKIFG